MSRSRLSLRVAFAAAGLLFASAAAAQEGGAPLAVRKNALKPGWFFVGVTAVESEKVPIFVEIQAGSETAPGIRAQSPDRRQFDLCAMLRSAQLADRPARLFVTVFRGKASTRFAVPYDGKGCRAVSRSASASSAALALPPLPSLDVVAPPEAPRDTPSLAAAEGPATAEAARASVAARTAAPEPAAPPDAPATRPEPRVAASEPTREPEAATAPRSATAPPDGAEAGPRPGAAAEPEKKAAPEPAPEPEAAQAPPPVSRTAAERGLTEENLEGIDVLLVKDKAARIEDYWFVLRFKVPVDVRGIETAVVLRAISARNRNLVFLDEGIEFDLDPVPNPAATLTVRFVASAALAVDAPAVKQNVSLKLRLGELPDAVFERKLIGVRNGKAR